MASKMAVSKAPKIFMTNILEEKQSNFGFLWMFRGLMIQVIKMEHNVLIQKLEILNMASKMADN